MIADTSLFNSYARQFIGASPLQSIPFEETKLKEERAFFTAQISSESEEKDRLERIKQTSFVLSTEPPVAVMLIDLCTALYIRLYAAGIIKEKPWLLGGAACHVLSGLNFIDIDIVFDIFNPDYILIEKSLIETLQELWITKKAPPPTADEITKQYISKRAIFHGYKGSILGLFGVLDIKFSYRDKSLLNERINVSTSDGFQISLFSDKVRCAHDVHFYMHKKGFESALYALKCRIFSVEKPEEVKGLIFRLLHKVTQGFELDNPQTRHIALAKLKTDYTPDQLRNLTRNHLRNHYPEDVKGKHIFFLNFLDAVMHFESEIDRRAYCQLIADMWLEVSKTPNQLIELIKKQPQLTSPILDFLRGSLLYAWGSKISPASLQAYAFPFMEKADKPRQHLAFMQELRTHYIVMPHNPIDLMMAFCSSWDVLEKECGSKFPSLFNGLSTDLSLDLPHLRVQKKRDAAATFVHLFEVPPLSSTLYMQYADKLIPCAVEIPASEHIKTLMPILQGIKDNITTLTSNRESPFKNAMSRCLTRLIRQIVAHPQEKLLKECYEMLLRAKACQLFTPEKALSLHCALLQAHSKLFCPPAQNEVLAKGNIKASSDWEISLLDNTLKECIAYGNPTSEQLTFLLMRYAQLSSSKSPQHLRLAHRYFEKLLHQKMSFRNAAIDKHFREITFQMLHGSLACKSFDLDVLTQALLFVLYHTDQILFMSLWTPAEKLSLEILEGLDRMIGTFPQPSFEIMACSTWRLINQNAPDTATVAKALFSSFTALSQAEKNSKHLPSFAAFGRSLVDLLSSKRLRLRTLITEKTYASALEIGFQLLSGKDEQADKKTKADCFKTGKKLLTILSQDEFAARHTLRVDLQICQRIINLVSKKAIAPKNAHAYHSQIQVLCSLPGIVDKIQKTGLLILKELPNLSLLCDKAIILSHLKLILKTLQPAVLKDAVLQSPSIETEDEKSGKEEKASGHTSLKIPSKINPRASIVDFSVFEMRFKTGSLYDQSSDFSETAQASQLICALMHDYKPKTTLKKVEKLSLFIEKTLTDRQSELAAIPSTLENTLRMAALALCSTATPKTIFLAESIHKHLSIYGISTESVDFSLPLRLIEQLLGLKNAIPYAALMDRLIPLTGQLIKNAFLKKEAHKVILQAIGEMLKTNALAYYEIASRYIKILHSKSKASLEDALYLAQLSKSFISQCLLFPEADYFPLALNLFLEIAQNADEFPDLEAELLHMCTMLIKAVPGNYKNAHTAHPEIDQIMAFAANKNLLAVRNAEAEMALLTAWTKVEPSLLVRWLQMLFKSALPAGPIQEPLPQVHLQALWKAFFSHLSKLCADSSTPSRIACACLALFEEHEKLAHALFPASTDPDKPSFLADCLISIYAKTTKPEHLEKACSSLLSNKAPSSAAAKHILEGFHFLPKELFAKPQWGILQESIAHIFKTCLELPKPGDTLSQAIFTETSLALIDLLNELSKNLVLSIALTTLEIYERLLLVMKKAGQDLPEGKVLEFFLNLSQSELIHYEKDILPRIEKLALTYLTEPTQSAYYDGIERMLEMQFKDCVTFINTSEKIDKDKSGILFSKIQAFAPYYAKWQPANGQKLLYAIFKKLQFLEFEGWDVIMSNLIINARRSGLYASHLPSNVKLGKKEKENLLSSCRMQKEITNGILPELCSSTLKVSHELTNHPYAHLCWLIEYTNFDNQEEVDIFTPNFVSVGQNAILKAMLTQNSFLFNIFSSSLNQIATAMLPSKHYIRFIAGMQHLINITLYYADIFEKVLTFASAKCSKTVDEKEQWKVIASIAAHKSTPKRIAKDLFLINLSHDQRLVLIKSALTLIPDLQSMHRNLFLAPLSSPILSETNAILLEVLKKFIIQLKPKISPDKHALFLEKSNFLCEQSIFCYSQKLSTDQQNAFQKRINSILSLV